MVKGIGLQLGQIWRRDALAQEQKLKFLGRAHDQGKICFSAEEVCADVGAYSSYDCLETIDAYDLLPMIVTKYQTQGS